MIPDAQMTFDLAYTDRRSAPMSRLGAEWVNAPTAT